MAPALRMITGGGDSHDSSLPVPQQIKNLLGILFADKGYIGKKLAQELSAVASPSPSVCART